MAIEVFPNPSSGQIRLDIDNIDGQAFKIFNNTGQLLTSGALTTEKVINIEQLNNGIYYLQLSNGQYSRFVIVK